MSVYVGALPTAAVSAYEVGPLLAAFARAADSGEVVKAGFRDAWLEFTCFCCGCRSLGSLAFFDGSKFGGRLMCRAPPLSGARKKVLIAAGAGGTQGGAAAGAAFGESEVESMVASMEGSWLAMGAIAWRK